MILNNLNGEEYNDYRENLLLKTILDDCYLKFNTLKNKFKII